MNRKVLLILALGLSVLIAFHVATSLGVASLIPLKSSVENTDPSNIVRNTAPCGDPIDTPGWPPKPNDPPKG